MISYRRLRREKRKRYELLELRKQNAVEIKSIFGKPNPKARSELYHLMKDKTDYKQQLDMMKEIFYDGGKKNGKNKFL
jgi:hypothetical protein